MRKKIINCWTCGVDGYIFNFMQKFRENSNS